MSVQNLLFLSSYHYRYIIIIILLISFFFIFDWTSISKSSHRFIIPSIRNNLLIRNLSISKKSVQKQYPFINRTININNSRVVRLAVVSAIYSDDYVEGIEVLGYSLRRINIQADLILFYISNRLNQVTLDRCRKVGWFLYAVRRIEPPRFAIIYQRFHDQYTKLHIWSMMGYDRVLYLDADTLVIRDVNELLYGTIFEDDRDELLGVVEDVWQGQLGPNFNAGVLLIRPNVTIFNDMLIKMHNMAAYGSYWAEQGFLNWYFKGSTGRLPLIYNFNNVLAIYHRDIYKRLRNRMKIIHYTYYKPFHIKKLNQLSDPSLIELWNMWNRMHDDMLNQSLIS
ncbi:unnamed protein product [Rotaria socialis]|uniref:glycogenin glucosyltransferase n=1 Tax=Rotaria socialis TaxID=392032 RepID=A0A817ZL13_9BILA|nr:unnamed protein product [Rotaria socialis]CAF4141346.1 unnamed protein product [Rotaria socialis]CAF4184795.1 unnamed protein product [Rotaria socialis]